MHCVPSQQEKSPATYLLHCTVAGFSSLLCLVSACYAQQRETTVNATVQVVIAEQALHRFSPWHAFGAGVDGHNEGETVRQLSPRNVKAMLSAGLKPLTYRLRTELANEAWHWNPRGSWSDAVHQQGYWTSSSKLGKAVEVSYGYRLPRRGNTLDQANNDGYSRLDDGDDHTFWKSNPYLDKHYTHDDLLPWQWIVIDLGAAKPINALSIAWAQPFAQEYRVEYGVLPPDDAGTNALPAQWRLFEHGVVTQHHGDKRVLRLARDPQPIRFVRILLSHSSHTTDRTSHDLRDRLGFAIREIYLGTFDRRGRFKDLMRHGTVAGQQSRIYVSSTDPWHRAVDRDPDTEQPGLDFVFRSGLTNDLSMLVPAAVLYDTPDNAAAEIKYLSARGYAFKQVELGEEPDGQFVTPEHYGALFRLFYRALHPLNSQLEFGGPSMQDIEPSPLSGDTTLSKAAWLAGFQYYLQQHHSLDEFSFFSFEWYPFGDDCDAAKQLRAAPQILTAQLRAMEQAGLTHRIPWVIAEYGYSAYGTRSEVDIEGALLNADSVARFLLLGGNAAYLYGYEPGDVIREQHCSAGNNMLFFRDARGAVTEKTATYWGAYLLTQQWAQPIDQLHELYATQVRVDNDADAQSLAVYAVHRPDDEWSLLMINKDPQHAFKIDVDFQDSRRARDAHFVGALTLSQYSKLQYQLNADAFNPYPIKAAAPLQQQVDAASSVVLPPYSLTVLRGRISTASP